MEGGKPEVVMEKDQSARRTFGKMRGARPIAPGLDRARSTPIGARRGLQQSREALMTSFRESLTQGQSRVKEMPRAVNMMTYLIQRDAHHPR